MEKILKFKSRESEMTGILHTPDEGLYSKKNLFVIVPYGLNNRIGPQRIYVRLARYLCDRGYYVFRPDSYGCGDSEGGLGELSGRHRDDVFWELIENKTFIDDVNDAVKFITAHLSPDNICLYGICGGAVRSIYYGIDNENIGALVLSSFPSSIDRGSANKPKQMTKNKAEFTLRFYMTKVFSPAAWIRILSFKSDYKSMIGSIKVLIMGKLFKGGKGIKTNPLPSDVNTTLVEYLKAFLSAGRNLMVVYGENDRYSENYSEKIEAPFLEELSQNDNYRKVVIKDSNHEFHLQIWQDKYFLEISNWLSEKLPLN